MSMFTPTILSQVTRLGLSNDSAKMDNYLHFNGTTLKVIQGVWPSKLDTHRSIAGKNEDFLHRHRTLQ
jgi:hypothetical protein